MSYLPKLISSNKVIYSNNVPTTIDLTFSESVTLTDNCSSSTDNLTSGSNSYQVSNLKKGQNICSLTITDNHSNQIFDNLTIQVGSIFIFRSNYRNTGNFTSIIDNICTVQASTLGIDNSSIYPFLSRGGSLKDLATGDNNSYPVVGEPNIISSNFTAQIISDTWSNLWDGSIDNSFDTVGLTFSIREWWSGTTESGDQATNRCTANSQDWSSFTGSGSLGETNKTDKNWINAYSAVSCNADYDQPQKGYPVYCVAFPNF